MRRIRTGVLYLMVLSAVSLIAIRFSGQVMESANQASMPSTRQLSGEEAKLLLDGLKKTYGLEMQTGKLRVTEGRKAESIFESLSLTQMGGGKSTCSYPSKGDVVSGVIIAEDKAMIYVDSKPCELLLYSIRKPYTKTKVGSISCKGKILDRYAITQH